MEFTVVSSTFRCVQGGPAGVPDDRAVLQVEHDGASGYLESSPMLFLAILLEFPQKPNLGTNRRPVFATDDVVLATHGALRRRVRDEILAGADLVPEVVVFFLNMRMGVLATVFGTVSFYHACAGSYELEEMVYFVASGVRNIGKGGPADDGGQDGGHGLYARNPPDGGTVTPH